ncbi:F-box/kelch-repeat protein At1g64840-like [Aristolochia californica]|uniref:F-box/kelch-repeat protein At1g64840-like n=1 Tax=Aristolochia californica TaxID=171875 RepID=UPI0035DF7B74
MRKVEKVDRQWSALPELVLDGIVKRLPSICDFLAFGRVCKSWRTVSLAVRKDFMASQSLYLLLPLRIPSQTFKFYSLQDKRCTVTTLPAYRCISFSCGYLIMTAAYSPLLINPISMHTIRIPKPPNTYASYYATLTTAPVSPNWSLLVFASSSNLLQVFGPSGWEMQRTPDGWDLMDLTFFENNLYMLSTQTRVAILDNKASEHGETKEMKLQEIGTLPHNEQRDASDHFLAESCGELLVVQLLNTHHPHGRRVIHVYRLKSRSRVWEEIQSLGDRALFLSSKCRSYATVSNPEKWGFKANSIYFTRHHMWYMARLEDSRVESVSPGLLPDFVVNWHEDSPVWIFPAQCC